MAESNSLQVCIVIFPTGLSFLTENEMVGLNVLMEEAKAFTGK